MTMSGRNTIGSSHLGLFVMMVMPLLVVVLGLLPRVNAFSSPAPAAPSYLQTVTNWLDDQEVAWRILGNDNRIFPQTSQPILQVAPTQSDLLECESNNNNSPLYFHILKSPKDARDVVSSSCTRDMTNYVATQRQQQNNNNEDGNNNNSNNNQPTISLIHLHQDVWQAKPEIVQSRLLMRLGRCRSRVFARKTVARRTDAATAIPFLQNHHLWSATKAKYYYGLFLKPTNKKDADATTDAEPNGETLVAVASFSARRKILRGGQPHRSHELIRFCAQRDGMVVGGITKLIKSFSRDQLPDDIVTVVDRDWGPGDGWHSLGFETVHVMAPLAMVVGSNDGIRRHLVGAGIQPTKNNTTPNITTTTGSNNNNSNNDKKREASGRPGVESHVLEELDSLNTHQDALQCLDKYKYYPVYDTGVERLLMIVPKSDPKATSDGLIPSALDLWKASVPSYADTYYSQNKGISALLDHAIPDIIVSTPVQSDSTIVTTTTTINEDKEEELQDSLEAQHSIADWRATGGTAKTAQLLYTMPSSLDPDAVVEVRERPKGWCTLGIVGGATKSIYHGIYKVVKKGDDATGEDCGVIDPSVLVSEHLRTMASVALTALELRKQQEKSSSTASIDISSNTVQGGKKDKAMSFLYFGYGAGSLPRFMAHAIPNSQHVAIELDDGVVRAAHQCQLLGPQVQLKLGDALAYQRSTTNNNATSDDEEQQQPPFDAIFVDIFDGDNLLPQGFYAESFLRHIQQNLLSPNGVVIHNFHTGSKSLGIQLEDATNAYQSIFGTTTTVDSLDSRHNAGNTILLASNYRLPEKEWHAAGRKARESWGIDFDVARRSTHKLQQ